jgi:hypothetical protein
MSLEDLATVATQLEPLLNQKVQVVTNDGRVLVGVMRGLTFYFLKCFDFI